MPEAILAETEEHLPAILSKRGMPVAERLAVLSALTGIVQTIDALTYSVFEKEAKLRLRNRDEEDWPVLATALAFKCPIWTEDSDFFASGVATWTTDRVEMFFSTQATADLSAAASTRNFLRDHSPGQVHVGSGPLLA